MKLSRINRVIVLTLQGWQKLEETVDKYEYQEKYGEKLNICCCVVPAFEIKSI
jgi:hypothetical protein